MALRLFIIDDHDEFRALLRQHLHTRWPAAELLEHDPATEPPLAKDFAGENLDLVLLDYQFGGGENGLDYLKRFRAQPGFPPVIMLTAAGNEDLAVEAIRAGAADYIPKQTMTHERLIASVQKIVEARAKPAVVAHETPAAEQPPAALQIPGCQLLRRLAEGGAGTIYLARRQATGETVCVKVMAQRLPTGEESKEAQRLSREYDAISRVDSPRIVRLHELGICDGHVYLVMEYFPNGSLRDLLLGPLPREEALNYLQQVAGALEIVHRAGILHRDLKPANIMLRTDGSVALIDFGTAKFAAGHAHTLTATGSVVGTPNYMSPEQCSGLVLTQASDIYALGILMYEMLTGTLPYEAATPLAVLYKHQYAPLPQLPENLGDLQPLLDKLLAKRPEDRYTRAREVARVLETAAQP
ncbi:MAG: protein kinase domain-containing protein [Gammaproteobacteria bacterium]